MAITNKEQGVWDVDQVYNKINQGGIWTYQGSETELYAWGYGFSGELAQNDGVTRSSPVQIPGDTWNTKSNAAFGYGNTASLMTKTDGTLWSWASGSRGVGAQNDTVSRSSPTQVGTDTTWAWVYSTYQNGYATKTDGTLWAWGGNGDGQMGINLSGDPGARSSPTQIGTGTDWSTADNCIAGARGGVWAIKSDGTLYSWGDNSAGMLGHNNQTKYSSPRQVPGTTWRSVGSGYNACFATKTNGTLYAWGEGFYGTLGQNNNSNYSSPRQIPGTNWSTVISSSYYGHTVTTKTDGTLWTWGNSQRGATGQNNETRLSSPTQVGTDTTWSNANAASRFRCAAIKTDGTLWSWGDNYQGGLGLNSQGDAHRKSSPTQIGTKTGWTQITPAASQYGGYFALKTAS